MTPELDLGHGLTELDYRILEKDCLEETLRTLSVFFFDCIRRKQLRTKMAERILILLKVKFMKLYQLLIPLQK